MSDEATNAVIHKLKNVQFRLMFENSLYGGGCFRPEDDIVLTDHGDWFVRLDHGLKRCKMATVTSVLPWKNHSAMAPPKTVVINVSPIFRWYRRAVDSRYPCDLDTCICSREPDALPTLGRPIEIDYEKPQRLRPCMFVGPAFSR
jgi:hypothetical protein